MRAIARRDAEFFLEGKMMRYLKLALAGAAATMALSGCGAFNEYVPADPNFAGYGVAPKSRYDAEREAYWANYRTPVGGATAGSSASGTTPATNAAGQCTVGSPAPCRFPDGSWGTCCASPQ